MATVTFRNTGRKASTGKVFCLGRNYATHAREMKSEIPPEPVVFLKPPTSLVLAEGRVHLPPGVGEVHHEVEMVAILGHGGKDIPLEQAPAFIAGYGVGLDMTLRDVQAEAKRKGLPWSIAKGFDTSAPVSEFSPAHEVAEPYNLDLTLHVNGALRQHGNTSEMLFRLDTIIAYLSRFFTLEEGDLIFTGTPEGVGPVERGDVLQANLHGVASLRVEVG